MRSRLRVPHRRSATRRSSAARRFAVALGSSFALWLAAGPALAVIEGNPPPPQAPQPTVCEGQAVVRTLTNASDLEVDGLHLVVYGPETLLEVGQGPDNPFGAPVFQGLDPEGAYHVRFGGATVAPGDSVRLALCFDGDRLDAAPVGGEGAQYWLRGDDALLEAPALPAVGVQLLPTHSADGTFDLQVAVSQAEQRFVDVDSIEFAFAAPGLLADLEGQVQGWKPLALDAQTLAPPADEETASVALGALAESVRFDDDRALYVRTTISAAAYEPRSEADEPDAPQPPSSERVTATSIHAIDLSSVLRPAYFDLRAREEAGQGFSIIQRSTLSLPVTGVEAEIFKLAADGADGEVVEVALDAEGLALDAEAAEIAEEAAQDQMYGSLSAELAQTLAETPDEPIRVSFWLHAPEADDDPTAPQRPDPEDAELSSDEADLLYATVDDYQRSLVADVTSSFAQRLSVYTEDVAAADMLPQVDATLTADQIYEVASWPEVVEVDEVPTFEPLLEVASATVNAPAVHAGGTTGTGERLAVVEVLGGRVNASNPFLPITVDNTNSCVSGHGAAVAGIVGSIHGTRRGTAPGAQLRIGGTCGSSLSGLRSATTRAMSWGARAVNHSWGSSAGTRPGSSDRAFDRYVSNNWRTMVVAAGNEAGWCRTRTGKITRPARGYNVLTVGNFDDRNTVGWADDVMNVCSSFVDPRSWKGDREKPEVAAPGTTINSTTNANPWTGPVGSGTSYAAPVVTGGAGLLFDRHGSLRVWPEAVKAIMMVSATNNIEGSARLSDRDGAGGVVLDQAADVARNGGSQQWGGRSYTCSSPSSLDVQAFTVQAGRRTRAAIVWNQRTDYWRYKSRPSADLDLRVIGPNGSIVASSSSWDNTYEIVDFTAPQTGTYRINVRKYRCSKSPRWLGWAWWTGPTTHIPGVSNHAQGAGMDIHDLDGNGRPDMVLMAYHAPWGGNTFRYKIGWNLDSDGRTNLWTGTQSVTGVGWEGQGAGVEVGDLNGNGRPDMVLMAYDNPWGGNTFRYKIGWDMVNGIASWWTGTTIVPGVGWEGQGAGVELVDVDGNGTDEMVVVAYDNPWGGNTFRYKIGWNVNAFGNASWWTGTIFAGGVGWEGQGAGVAAGDIDGNGTLDLLHMAYDNPAGANTFRYKIGWNLSTSGTTSWWHSAITGGVGWEADGADPELYDIDGDGDLELFLMAYDDPYLLPNTFRYRVISP